MREAWPVRAWWRRNGIKRTWERWTSAAWHTPEGAMLADRSGLHEWLRRRYGNVTVRNSLSRLGTGSGIAACKGDQSDQFITMSTHDDDYATRY